MRCVVTFVTRDFCDFCDFLLPAANYISSTHLSLRLDEADSLLF